MKKKILIVGAVLTMTFSSVGYTGLVSAETNIDEKKEKVSKKLNKVETSILNSTRKINEINLDIDSLENSILVNEQEITRITKDAARYKKEIKSLKKEIVILNDEIEVRNEILKERLSSYQNSGGDLGYMEVIFGSAGFEDFISRFTAVVTITKADNELVEEQKNAINKVEENEGQVKEKLTATKKVKKELTEINKEQKTQKKELTKSKKTVQSKVSELKDKKFAYIDEGNDLEALEQRIEEELRETDAGLSEATETSSVSTTEDAEVTERTEDAEVTETREDEEATETREDEEATETREDEEATETREDEEATETREEADSTEATETQIEQVTNEQTEEPTSSNTQSNPRQEAQAPTQAAPAPSQSTSQSTATEAPTRQPEAQTQAPSNNKPKPKPKPKPAPAEPSGGSGILSDAHALTGTTYKSAGTTPAGFDCSGYTSFVYKQNGINLPRTASAQYAAYPKVSKSQLRAGDLVFFSSSPGGGAITHVGISLGGSQYIGSQTSTGVAVTSINDPYYWGPRFVGGARPN